MDNRFSFLTTNALEELQHFVHETLCQREGLDMMQSPLSQTLIKRRGKPCGIFFQVDGPRRMKNYAVWSSEENRVLFYDSAGMRFAEMPFAQYPRLSRLAA